MPIPKTPAAISALLLLLAGCGAETLSQSYEIDRTRILAVKSEPAEPVPGQPAQLSALVVHPTYEMEAVTWIGCLASAADAFGCDLSAVESLDADALETMTDEEIAELLDSLEYFGIGESPINPYLPDAALLNELTEEERDEGLNLLVTLTAIPNTQGAPLDEEIDVEIAYKRIPISLASTPNENPVIARLLIDGQEVAPGGTITLTREQTYAIEPLFDEASIQTYSFTNDDGDEETRTEEPYLTFYMTHGAPATNPYSLYPYTTMEYVADPGEDAGDEPVDVTLWIVARDRRGGMDWWTQKLRIE